MSRVFTKLNDWVTLVKMQVPDEVQPYYYLEVRDYVSVIAVNERNEIAFVKQFRPTLDRKTLELPGGIIEQGQSPQEAGIKELLEETGLGAISTIAELKPRFIDTARLNLQNHTIVLTTRSEMVGSPESGIELIWVHADDLLKLLEDGDISLESHSGAIAQALLFHYI